jgi:hypothetical protein
VELADDLGYGVGSLRETEQRKRFEASAGAAGEL